MLHSNLIPMSLLLKTKHDQGLQETPDTRKHCNLITHFLCASHTASAGNGWLSEKMLINTHSTCIQSISTTGLDHFFTVVLPLSQSCYLTLLGIRMHKKYKAFSKLRAFSKIKTILWLLLPQETHWFCMQTNSGVIYQVLIAYCYRCYKLCSLCLIHRKYKFVGENAFQLKQQQHPPLRIPWANQTGM